MRKGFSLLAMIAVLGQLPASAGPAAAPRRRHKRGGQPAGFVPHACGIAAASGPSRCSNRISGMSAAGLTGR